MGGASPENVHTTSVEQVAMVLLVFGVCSIPNARRLVRLDAWATDPGIQQARYGQRVIANELGFQLQTRAAREQAIVRVALELLSRHGGGLPVGGAGHDEPDQ